MPTTSPPTSVAVLDSAVTWTQARLRFARGVRQDRSTPCRDWHLGALLDHLDDSLLTLAEAAELGHVAVDPRPVRATLALVDRVEQRADRTRTAWLERLTSAPVSIDDLVLGRDTLVLVGALEIAVHGWDVAQATGEREPLPDELAARLLEVADAVITREDRGRRFGPQLMTPRSATESTRLLAYLGRQG